MAAVKIRGQLEAEFLIYHAAHPFVYILVCRFAQEAIDKGYTRYGMGAIWERVRWEVLIHTRSNIEAEDFKMPNNHRAYYARLWLKDHPEHAGEKPFFRIAELRSLRGTEFAGDRYGR